MSGLLILFSYETFSDIWKCFLEGSEYQESQYPLKGQFTNIDFLFYRISYPICKEGESVSMLRVSIPFLWENSSDLGWCCFKDTHREKAPSNPTFNSLYKVLIPRQYFQKNKVVTSKTTFFVISLFRVPHSIYLNFAFWQGSFVWKCWVLNLSTLN